MKHDTLDDVSKTLIDDAEHDCAESDPELCESAGMVLVGDVYALRVTRGIPLPGDEPPREDDASKPFIR
jgi:hypothetical protein